MNKCTILIVIIFFVACFTSKSQQRVKNQESLNNITNGDTAIYKELMQMDFSKYLDREASLFFNDLSYKYRSVLPITRKPLVIDRLQFYFGDSISVIVAVKGFKQEGLLKKTSDIDIDGYLRNKVSSLSLTYGGKCIKGCDKE